MEDTVYSLVTTACNATEEALSWAEDFPEAVKDGVEELLIRAYNLLNAASKQIDKNLAVPEND